MFLKTIGKTWHNLHVDEYITAHFVDLHGGVYMYIRVYA